MAKFEGVKWAPRQMRYLLPDKQFDILESDSKVFAVSRSVFYASCLCFEGIRFFCKKSPAGALEVHFLNWHKNLERLRRGISFNLSKAQADLVPSVEELESILIHQYFGDPAIRAFLEDMADQGSPRLPPAVHGRRGAVHGRDLPRPAGRAGHLLQL